MKKNPKRPEQLEIIARKGKEKNSPRFPKQSKSSTEAHRGGGGRKSSAVTGKQNTKNHKTKAGGKDFLAVGSDLWRGDLPKRDVGYR